jgi:hypothetical protein
MSLLLICFNARALQQQQQQQHANSSKTKAHSLEVSAEAPACGCRNLQLLQPYYGGTWSADTELCSAWWKGALHHLSSWRSATHGSQY